MYTLQDIKDQYYMELAMDDKVRCDLQDYVREHFIPVYDEEFNFIGWDKK